MRWDDLFEDLEAQAGLLTARERAGEVDDLVRAEVGRIGLSQRLLPSIGAAVSIGCRGDLRVSGRLARVGPDWVLVEEDADREALIALDSVLSVAGLTRLSAAADSVGPVSARLGLRSALRSVAQDRSAVLLHSVDGGALRGTIDRVGADFLELAIHPGAPVRRRGEVREVVVVPQCALSAVRRQAG